MSLYKSKKWKLVFEAKFKKKKMRVDPDDVKILTRGFMVYCCYQYFLENELETG